MEPSIFILTITDMLGMFGAFMAVLIAIEIFVNITIYLREDVIHVKRSQAQLRRNDEDNSSGQEIESDDAIHYGGFG